MDKRLRELQRRFQESGTVEDEAAMLREAVRAGILTQDQLTMAAQMEHPASLLIVPPTMSPFRPFQGGGVPQYEALEEFLFELFTISPDLPYRLGLAYLRQTLPIFDTDPHDMLEIFNAITHHQSEILFPDRARNYINTFQQWIDAAFCSVFEPVSDTEWGRLANLVRSQEFRVWFDSAGYFELEFGDTAAFHNAANAFHNYIRALVNCYDENRRVTPGEIKASLQHLRLSINGVVDAVIEASDINHRHEVRVLPTRISFQQTILRRVRPEIIPLLLG